LGLLSLDLGGSLPTAFSLDRDPSTSLLIAQTHRSDARAEFFFYSTAREITFQEDAKLGSDLF
jgi:hypothetical protein